MRLGSMNDVSNPGQFATSRRGGLTSEDMRQIEALRAAPRPTPWSALSKRFGRCEADLRAIFHASTPAAANGDEAEEIGRPAPWTEERIERLRRLYVDEGKSQFACADEMELSREAVGKAVARFGFKRTGPIRPALRVVKRASRAKS